MLTDYLRCSDLYFAICSMDYWHILHYIKTLWTWQVIQLYSQIIRAEDTRWPYKEGFLRLRQSFVWRQMRTH